MNLASTITSDALFLRDSWTFTSLWFMRQWGKFRTQLNAMSAYRNGPSFDIMDRRKLGICSAFLI